MSLDIYITNPQSGAENFEWNITHNLARMARELDIYQALWHPDTLGIDVAGDMIQHLEPAYTKLAVFGEYYDQFAPDNGWGNRQNLFELVDALLRYAKRYPECRVTVSR